MARYPQMTSAQSDLRQKFGLIYGRRVSTKCDLWHNSQLSYRWEFAETEADDVARWRGDAGRILGERTERGRRPEVEERGPFCRRDGDGRCNWQTCSPYVPLLPPVKRKDYFRKPLQATRLSLRKECVAIRSSIRLTRAVARKGGYNAFVSIDVALTPRHNTPTLDPEDWHAVFDASSM
jgi:hypothetical protein